MTFGQRIELGKIVASKKDELTISIEVIKCLHNFTPSRRQIIIVFDYLNSIYEGLLYWSEIESMLLKHEPTTEEKLAGIKDLSKKIGEMGTVKALAKNYGVDPDIILTWKYSKVFGILYTDLQEYKYQLRYNKVIESKYKK